MRFHFSYLEDGDSDRVDLRNIDEHPPIERNMVRIDWIRIEHFERAVLGSSGSEDAREGTEIEMRQGLLPI